MERTIVTNNNVIHNLNAVVIGCSSNYEEVNMEEISQVVDIISNFFKNQRNENCVYE